MSTFVPGVMTYTANHYLILYRICMYLKFNNTSHINICLAKLPYDLNCFRLVNMFDCVFCIHARVVVYFKYHIWYTELAMDDSDISDISILSIHIYASPYIAVACSRYVIVTHNTFVICIYVYIYINYGQRRSIFIKTQLGISDLIWFLSFS